MKENVSKNEFQPIDIYFLEAKKKQKRNNLFSFDQIHLRKNLENVIENETSLNFLIEQQIIEIYFL